MNNLETAMLLINRLVNKLVKTGEKEVKKRFAQTLTEARSMLASLYEKYETGGVLTYAEMAKYDRLRKFLKELNQEVSTNYKDVAENIVKMLEKVFQEGYYLTAWGIETEARAMLAYSAVSSDFILAAINNPISGLTLKERLEKQRGEIIYRIQQEVTQGLIKGETYKTMASRIKGALDMDATKAVRIVRTEAHRVQESAKHDSVAHAAKQGIIMMKQWNSLEDSRVRSSHTHLNNKRIPVDQEFKGHYGRGLSPGNFGVAAEDIHCRCFLTYTVEGVEKPQHSVMADMTFDEWMKKRIKKT